MRFWLLHSGEVPIQDQIVAQVSLGVLSGELAPGERLPSVRELARRFHIHANTVSLAYRRLERELWLESRRGSGMYVRVQVPAAAGSAETALDPLLRTLIQNARTLGVSADTLHRSLDRLLAAPTAYLLLEPDPALARIVLAELASLTRLPVTTQTGFESAAIMGTVALVLPSKAAAARSALAPEVAMKVLGIRSVPQSLAEWLPAPVDALIGVASHWPPFLDFARTMLIAAGFHGDALLLRNANQPGWQQGLGQAVATVCDSYTATLLPGKMKLIPFRLLAEDAADTLNG